MPVRDITPYLHFDGHAAAAIEHYEAQLGAEIDDLLRFGDMKEHPFGPEANERIMHALLRVGGARLMLSDLPPGQPLTRGDDVQVTLEFDDVEELTRSFEGLAEGGEVTMALHDAFWGAKFGILTDKYGVCWKLVGPGESLSL
jgi:PhnB protein